MTRATPGRLALARLAYTCACLLALAAFVVHDVVPAARHPDTVGFVAYYTESRVLLESPRDLPRVYDERWLQARIDRTFERHVPDLIQAQPPGMSLLMLPVAWMPPRAARVSWTLLSVACWLASLVLLARALGIERRLREWPGVAALAGLALVSLFYRPLADNLRQGQAYAVLLLLLSTFYRLWLRPGAARRRWLAGVPLGVMLAVKSAAIWPLALLAVGRRWRPLGGAALGVALIALPPWPLLGWEMWRSYLRGFAWIAGEPSLHVTAYQTVNSLAGHLFVYDARFNPAPVAHLPALARALTAVVTAAAFGLSARAPRALRDDQRFGARVLTLAMGTALIVSLLPLAEGHHYLLVFPSIACAWWWLWTSWPWLASGPRRRRAVALALACALLCVPRSFFHAAHVQRGWLALLAYPRLYGAFGLWWWLLRELDALRRGAAQPLPAAELESSSRTT